MNKISKYKIDELSLVTTDFFYKKKKCKNENPKESELRNSSQSSMLLKITKIAITPTPRTYTKTFLVFQ